MLLTLGNGVQPGTGFFVAGELILIVFSSICFAYGGHTVGGAWYSPVRVGEGFLAQDNDSIKVCKGRLEDCCWRNVCMLMLQVSLNPANYRQ